MAEQVFQSTQRKKFLKGMRGSLGGGLRHIEDTQATVDIYIKVYPENKPGETEHSGTFKGNLVSGYNASFKTLQVFSIKVLFSISRLFCKIGAISLGQHQHSSF